MRWSGVAAAVVMLLMPGTVIAQSSDTDLVKELANPISSLISVLFQEPVNSQTVSRYLCTRLTATAP